MALVLVEDDSTIVQQNPTSNYGSESWIEIRNDTTYQEKIGISSTLFDRKPIKTGSLVIYRSGISSSSDGKFNVYPLRNDFNEGSVTWNSPFIYNTEPVKNVTDTTSSGWTPIECKDQLNACVSRGFAGVAITKDYQSVSDNLIGYHSNEGANAPYFSVTYASTNEILSGNQFNTYNGTTDYMWGTVSMTGYSESPDKVQYNVTLPWSTVKSGEWINAGETIIYEDLGTPNEYYALRLDSLFVGAEVVFATFTEWWWFSDGLKQTYVSTSGDDSDLGASWGTAYRTVHKGMTEVEADSVIHVGFGSYTTEPANNTLSPVNDDVTVMYETAVTGGGTGTATMEVN